MINNPISIRTANLDDLETLLQFEQGVIAFERPLDSFLADGDLCYYNIPHLITSKEYHKNPKHGYIGFIFVKPAFRGQRISSLILESLKDWAKEKDLKELRLDVYSNNVGAIKAYERFGLIKSLVNMRMDI